MMSKPAKSVPEGHHTVTPYLAVKDASKAIEFYKQAFGAIEKGRMPGPDGAGVMHAELKRKWLSEPKLPLPKWRNDRTLKGQSWRVFPRLPGARAFLCRSS
jgi:hypothetical protein